MTGRVTSTNNNHFIIVSYQLNSSPQLEAGRWSDGRMSLLSVRLQSSKAGPALFDGENRTRWQQLQGAVCPDRSSE